MLKRHAGGAGNEPIKKHLSYLTKSQSYWLLLQGALDSPKIPKPEPKIPKPESSSKQKGDKKLPFLNGLVTDLKTVCNFLDKHKKDGAHLLSYSFQMRQTREITLLEIKKLLIECKTQKTYPVIYYTGHGELGTGNWCFLENENGQRKNNSYIGIAEILQLFPDEGLEGPLTIISDCCYSGHWADYCALNETYRKRVIVLASAPYYSSCEDGKFVESLFESEDAGFSVPPVLGLYERYFVTYPHSVKVDNFEDLLLGHTLKKSNKEDTLISCSFAGNKFGAIFAKEGSCKGEKSFYERKFDKIKKHFEDKGTYTRIISKTKRGYFIYQHKQQVKNDRIDQIHLPAANIDDIQKNLPNAKQVVSCCPGEDGKWFVVMDKLKEQKLKTDDKPKNIAKEFKSLECCIEFKDNMESEHYRLTTISQDGDRYLVFMNHNPNEIIRMKLFDKTNNFFKEVHEWMEEQLKEKFQPYLIFKDWKSAKTLIALTNNMEKVYSDVDLILDGELPKISSSPINNGAEESQQISSSDYDTEKEIILSTVQNGYQENQEQQQQQQQQQQLSMKYRSETLIFLKDAWRKDR